MVYSSPIPPHLPRLSNIYIYSFIRKKCKIQEVKKNKAKYYKQIEKMN